MTKIANLRAKERGRVGAIAHEFGPRGIQTIAGDDWIEIPPGATPPPVKVETDHDRRVALAFSRLGPIPAGIEILDPGCLRQSLPRYGDRPDRFEAHHSNT